MRESNEVVDRDAVLQYFAGKEVLSHYEEATLKMGLCLGPVFEINL